MDARPPVRRPTWTRRVPGWAFLLFFVSLILFTYFAVYAWNKGDLVTTAYLAALASIVPVLLVGLVYVALPVWAIPVPLPVEEVAQALSRAARDRRVRPVESREGPFARCVSVVRYEAPPCTVGWYPSPVAGNAMRTAPQSIVVLRPETRDRRALAAFREALARSLLAPGPSPG